MSLLEFNYYNRYRRIKIMFSFIIFLAIITTILAFIGFDMITHFSGLVNFIGAVALGVGVFLTFKPNKKKQISLDLDDSENSKLLQESYQKALEDYNYIKGSLKYIKDSELKMQLQEMQKVSSNILRYLQKHPEKISLARRFIDYYQDTVAGLIEKYVEIENTQLNTENVNDIKERTKSTLFGLSNAYTEQFEKLINDQLMDMDAELKVMENTIKADGFDVKKHDDYDKEVNSGFSYRRKNNMCNRPMKKMRWKLKNLPEKFFDSDEVLRKKLIAGGLGILFGGFGAHKFYLGKTFMGIFYLLFSWTGIPFIAGFIEGIRYLFMDKDDFYHKFLDNMNRG